MPIKNIIFDLGGVILNIDYNLTIQAFKDLGIQQFDRFYTQAQQSTIFDDIETGKTSPQDFINELKQLAGINVPDEKIINAWNAMLLNLPKERIELLKKVKSNYNTFLLSNTNIIHFEAYMHYFNEAYQLNFNSLFHKAYYSHEIGLRKPHAEVFNYVLEDQKLVPSETVFIDDSEQHIIGAKSTGINAVHLSNGKTIMELFDKTGNYLIS